VSARLTGPWFVVCAGEGGATHAVRCATEDEALDVVKHQAFGWASVYLARALYKVEPQVQVRFLSEEIPPEGCQGDLGDC